jgi:hypothetical protein
MIGGVLQNAECLSSKHAQEFNKKARLVELSYHLREMTESSHATVQDVFKVDLRTIPALLNECSTIIQFLELLSL